MKNSDVLQRTVTRRAMYLLEEMDRTENDLRRKLKKSQYPEEMIEQAIEYVKSYGYIDDSRYARNYIRYRLASKSKLQLWQALYRKGIDRYTFQDAWEEVAGEENPDESQLILRLVKKKCGDKKELDQKEYRRLQGYLARRGFSWEKVNAVLNEAEITLVRD